MGIKIVLATPDTQFGELIKKYLEKSGKLELFIVNQGIDILWTVDSKDFAVLIMDSRLPDCNIFDLGIQLKDYQPELRTIALISEKERKPEWVMMQAFDASLIAPFAPNDLVRSLVSVLKKKPLSSGSDPPSYEKSKILDESQSRDLNLNVPKAAQYLTQLSLKSSSQAALITRDRTIVAYAGQLEKDAAEEIGFLIGDYWEKDGGSDFARFVSLKSTNTDHMIYATGLDKELVLALVYEADMPFSEIRTQAGELSAKLSEIKEKRAAVKITAQKPQQNSQVKEVKHPGRLEDIGTQDRDTDEPADQDKQESEQEAGFGKFLASLDLPGSGVINQERPEDESNRAKKTPPFTAANEDKTDEPSISDGIIQSRVQRRTTGIPEIRRKTRHTRRIDSMKGVQDSVDQQRQRDIEHSGISSAMSAPVLFNIGYSSVMIPRLPNHYLVDDLAESLTRWMTQFCLAYGWRLSHLAVLPDHIEWAVRAEPDQSPKEIFQTLSDLTSERIFEKFPKINRENPSGKFWAPGFIIVVGTKPIPPAIIKKFIKQTRRYQGV